jgi:CBS domain containing-hemolysin-like protein
MSVILIPVGIISLLILLNGIFVAAEFSIVAVSRTRMAQLAEAGSRTAQSILKTLRDPNRQNRYIATAQVGITVVSLGLGMYGEHTVARWLLTPLERLGRLAEPAAHTIASALAIAMLTYLHVVIGEMVPKSLALQFPERTALGLNGPMMLTERVFLPVVTALNEIGNGITRLIGVPPADVHTRLFSAEELEFIVEESYEGGLIEPTEQLFIENIFDFSERTIGQVMTPRKRIIGIPVTASEDEVLQQVCEARFSRYPVYEESLDHIIGILHLKDLARYHVHHSDTFDLRRLARTTIFVPESLSLDEMLIRFRRQRSQIAIVLDEFGGTAGLITLEDLVEDVVGEIQDEFDQEIPPMREFAPGVLRVRGDLLLEELNQHYDLGLEHPEADNVNGLMMALLGRVSHPGDVVTYAGVTFEVESVDGLAVQTAIVRLPVDEPAKEL